VEWREGPEGGSAALVVGPVWFNNGGEEKLSAIENTQTANSLV
jgi:hypothetical protein